MSGVLVEGAVVKEGMVERTQDRDQRLGEVDADGK